MSKRKKEKRAFPFELRAAEGGDGESGVLRLDGKSVVFDQEAIIGNSFREVIRQGSATKTLRETDQVMLWGHDSTMPLGRKSAGSLRVKQVDDGIEVSADLNDKGGELTSWARDAHISVKRGLVKGMSFLMQVVKDTWTEEEGKLPLREITEIKIDEFSPVTFPAYPTTEIEARAILDEIKPESSVPPETTSEPDTRDHSDTEPDPTDHSEAEQEERKRPSLAMRRRRLNLLEASLGVNHGLECPDGEKGQAV